MNDSCKKKIDAARTAYNVLNAEQKTLVVYSQLKILTDAEAQYDKLKTTADNIAKQKAQQEALKKKYTPSKTSIKSIKKLKKNQVKLTWKKVKNATGYEVYPVSYTHLDVYKRQMAYIAKDVKEKWKERERAGEYMKFWWHDD